MSRIHLTSTESDVRQECPAFALPQAAGLQRYRVPLTQWEQRVGGYSPPTVRAATLDGTPLSYVRTPKGVLLWG